MPTNLKKENQHSLPPNPHPKTHHVKEKKIPSPPPPSSFQGIHHFKEKINPSPLPTSF
jgi:hypothetical protein